MLLISSVWPEPGSSAAGVRDFGIIEAFRRQNIEVSVVSAAQNEKGLRQTKALGIRCHSIEMNHSSFDETLKTLSPDVVIFDRFIVEEQFGSRVRRVLPQALRVLDTQDLHFLRRFRKSEPPFSVQIPPTEQDALREVASILRSDWTWLVSSFEQSLLQDHFDVSKSLLSTVRFFYDNPPERKPYDSRKGYAWIGNFRHAPNADSIQFLVKTIWPLIQKIQPDAELKIGGAYPPAEVMSLHSPQNGIHVLGEVDSLQELLESAKVSLAPLRFGAGIKGKISDSWFYGTPVITTSVGAEGMSDSNFAAKVENSSEEFARAAVSVYQDSETWASLQKKGFEILSKEYSWKCAEKMITECKTRLISLDANRQKNIFGEVLWLQTNRSTEYFSRWIELKGRISKT